jgi:hypothetical protein
LPLRTPTGILLNRELSDSRYMTRAFGSGTGTVDSLDVVVANLPLLMLMGGLAATFLAIAAVVGVLVLVSAAIFGFPEIVVAGRTFEAGWVLLRFGPLLVLHGGLAGMVAYGLWMEKHWSRVMVSVFWVSVIASASFAAILHPVGGRFWFLVALGCSPILLGSWLYLYYWGAAVAYYDGSRQESST